MERIKSYAKEKDVSLNELRNYLLPGVKKTKAYEDFLKLIESDYDYIIDAIDSIHEIKLKNQIRFKNCGFLCQRKSGHIDCKALNKAYCLTSGTCNFFKTKQTIQELNKKYGSR